MWADIFCMAKTTKIWISFPPVNSKILPNWLMLLFFDQPVWADGAATERGGRLLTVPQDGGDRILTIPQEGKGAQY